MKIQFAGTRFLVICDGLTLFENKRIWAERISHAESVLGKDLIVCQQVQQLSYLSPPSIFKPLENVLHNIMNTKNQQNVGITSVCKSLTPTVISSTTVAFVLNLIGSYPIISQKICFFLIIFLLFIIIILLSSFISCTFQDKYITDLFTIQWCCWYLWKGSIIFQGKMQNYWSF